MGDHTGRRIACPAATCRAIGSVEAGHAVESAGLGRGVDTDGRVQTAGSGDACGSPLPVTAGSNRVVRRGESAGRESAGRADSPDSAPAGAAAGAADYAATAGRGRLLRPARAGRPVGAACCALPTRQGDPAGIRRRSWAGLLHAALAVLTAFVGLPAESGPARRRRDRSAAGSTARQPRRAARSDRACPRCRGRRIVATPGSRLPFDTICCPECR
ncbi:hypothetical protein UA75_09295 [Actinoalloteichus sp. GBA129-24]|uniref:Uncharacterized protein n=1 Tax=Actinoalloteichus fjordicus TaxID=1612552 RepID=A0AAC9LBM8_9PSEU|nr:hypothetical protein UA74_09325 [Actinoalloteichus fjordicus]APU19875.1 hypothetical protein UA75_09295 [Actinoalloteichus sp. GBA129-24]